VADEFRAYRPWFWAAVVYNLTWGISVIVYPRWFLWSANMTASATPLAQAAGMMVAVYAYGYYLLARDPQRFAPFIWIALAGKTFGAIGYVSCAITGALPWRFGANTLMNDVIWLPAFWVFALRYGRRSA
jgi:hypothetical protein